jgi:integrase
MWNAVPSVECGLCNLDLRSTTDVATIVERKRVNGSVGYTVVIRIKKAGKIVHQESKTFSIRVEAQRWARRREVELENPAALIRAQQGALSVGALIRWYIDEFEQPSQWQRSKGQQLRSLEKQTLAQADATALTCQSIIDFIRIRRRAGVAPSTAGNDLSWLRVVLRAAKSVRGAPVQPEVVDEARFACRELRLIAKSKRRDRRPTAIELQRLDIYFGSRDGRAEIPMQVIMGFAIHSARRQAEICRLEWTDLDPSSRSGMVRDVKHPRAKIGNHRCFKFTPEAWDLVQSQPRTSEYIFPYNPRSVGDAFTRACGILGIADLRFHDLRHEATSRLFERGYAIHEVAQFTLHDSWNELKRYTHQDPRHVRELPEPPRCSEAA